MMIDSPENTATDEATRLQDIFCAERMQTGVQISSSKRLLEVMSDLFTRNNRFTINKETVFRVLYEREQLGSTCLGNGVTIPHGRLNDLPGALGAIVRMKTPLTLGSDNQSVLLACGLLVPADRADAHIKLLARLAEGFEKHDLHRQLMDAEDAEQMFATLVRFDEEIIGART